MANRTYVLSDFVGTSTVSSDEAIRNAVARACQSVEHVDWFEVTQIRGYVRAGAVDHFQVALRIGARLSDV